ncbi:MAG: NAD(+)/NADH kinase, partial [Kiritimatiellae bacterium]|nr:NAD(+)/NADH kinase [Kiritimatiellia bacterium]
MRRDLAAALPEAGLQEAESAEEADIVIALGGDGTILDAVRESPGKPVAGFNIGVFTKPVGSYSEL